MKLRMLIEMASRNRAVVAGSLLLAFGAGCAPRGAPPAAPQARAPAASTPAALAGCSSHENLNAVLWMQTAVEYRGTARQAYAAATAALDRALADPSWSAAIEQQGRDVGALPPAVILDLDETVLDNSPFQARLARSGGRYTEAAWRAWVDERLAGSIPGAVEFLKTADTRGVAVFYVTNREAVSEPATRDVLRQLGLPLDGAGRDVVLTRRERPDWESSEKSSRRAAIARDFRIVMLVGDDLGDFLPGARGSVEERDARVAPYESWWGSRWFVLPNPTYGSWEGALTEQGGGGGAPAESGPAGKCARLRIR